MVNINKGYHMNTNGIGTPTEVLPEGEVVVEDVADGSDVVAEPKEPKATDYITGIIRQEGELYCDYRCRLYWEQQLLKRYLAGRSIWVGDQRGEARNPMRKHRDSKQRLKKNDQSERKQAIRESQGKRTADTLNTTRKARKRMKELVGK